MSTTRGQTNPGFLLAAIGGGVAGAAMFNLAPLFLSAAMQTFSLDDRQIGLLMSTEVAGIALASLVGLILAPRLGCRTLMLTGAIMIMLGNMVARYANDFDSLLAIRFLTGFFGDGLAYVAAIIALAYWHNPTRAFALLSLTNMCLAGSALMLLPRLPGAANWPVMTVFIAGIAFIAFLAAILRLPPGTGRSTNNDVAFSGLFYSIGMLPIIGLFVYTINLGAVWTYVERIGNHIGLDGESIGLLLGVSMAFQGLGSLSAAVLSRKIGRLPPLLATLVMQLAALYMLGNASSGAGFLVATALWGFSWNIGIANMLGLIAGLAGGSRLLALAPGVEACGASVGPVLVALLLVPGDYTAVIMVGAVSIVASIALCSVCALARQASATA